MPHLSNSNGKPGVEFTPLNPTLGKWRQVDLCAVKISLVYLASFRPVGQNHVSKESKSCHPKDKLGRKTLLSARRPGRLPAQQHPRLPQQALDYNFYRKFYSTYNIFQQKGNIQENWCTLLLQNKQKYRGGKCGLLLLFELQTRHAAGISSNRKGPRRGLRQSSAECPGRRGHSHSPNTKWPPPRANCTGFIH